MNITVGCGLLIATTVVHATAMVGAIGMLRAVRADRWARVSGWTRVTAVAAMVVMMFLAAVLEAGLWAVTYLGLGAITGLERALYFSTVTYTTLGYGDVVMDEQWRLLSSFEAANGTIMFGWTTAVIVAAVHKVYLTEQKDHEETA